MIWYTSIQNFGVIHVQIEAQQNKLSQPRSAPRRRVATPRPRRLGIRAPPEVTSNRGCAPSAGSRSPRCLEAHAPRGSPALRRTSVRGAARTCAGRGAPWYDDIFPVTATSRSSALFKHRRPSRAPCRAALAVHPPWLPPAPR
jgi:hypothetical protein